METIRISRTDNEALVFDGEMLAKASSPQYETEDGSRGYELALYAQSEGGFVVSIQYLTTCPDERSVTQAEIVDEPDDVEKVFLVFEPCEYVDRKMLRALPDERRQKLRRALYGYYDDQVSKVLSAVTEHFGTWRLDAAEHEQPRVPEPKRGDPLVPEDQVTYSHQQRRPSMFLFPRLLGLTATAFAVAITIATTISAQPTTAQSSPVASATDTLSNEITADIVEARRKSTEESSELDEETKKKTVEFYRQAMEQLRAAQTFDSRSTEFVSRAGNADERVEVMTRESEQTKPQLESAKRRLEMVQSQLADPDFDPQLELGKLEKKQKALEQQLKKLREVLTKLETESTNRSNRRKEIRSRLAALEMELAEVDKQHAAPPPAGEHALLSLAKRTELLAHKQTISKERPALENELLAYDAEDTVDQLRLERDLLSQQVALATAELQISELLLKRKKDNTANDAVLMAKREAKRIAWPINESLAQRNLELAERNRQVAKETADLEAQHKRLTTQLDELTRKFELTRKKVESVGLAASVGAMLRKQRNSLPDVRAHRAAVTALKPIIVAAQLELFDLDDERESLAHIDTAVRQHVYSQADDILTLKERNAAAQEARALLARRPKYLDPLIRNQNAYFDALAELSITEQQLLTRSMEFSNFIDARVLWTRSGQPLTTELDMKTSVSWLLDAVNWTAGGRRLIEDVKSRPYWYIIFFGFFLAVARCSKPMRHRIHAIGEMVQRSSFSEFFPTIQAAVLTVLVSALWPSLIAFLGWRLSAIAGDDEFLRGLARGMYFLAWGSYFLELLRQFFRPNGLAEAHFQWPQVTVNLLRRSLRWMMLLGLPIVLVIATLQASDQNQGRNSLERVFFIVGTLVLSAIIARTWHPLHGVFHFHMALHPDGWASRLRHIWYAVAVASPLLMGGLALFGYYYTAQQLAWRVYVSLVFAVALIVLNGFLRRLLMVHRRRLSIEQARQRRAAMAEASAESTDTALEIPLDESIADLSVQTSQTRRLVATVLLGVAFVGFWLIWVDVLPALDFLEHWPLWETTTQITERITNDAGDLQTRTRDTIHPITIADLILALLIATVTLIAAQNVPGLLEISVLQRLPLEPSIRYAITTLGSYMIVLVGLIAACNAIGLRWSQIQWMATALTFGLAFGLQEMFANFVAGIIILFERPIRVGDIVTVDDISGIVSRVRIRATTITDWDRKDFVVPNKDFITGRILNWTLSDLVSRVVIKVGVAYGSNTDRAKELLLKIADEQPHIVDDPPPLATFEEFGESSLTIVLRCFMAMRDMPSRLRIIDSVHSRIDQEFKKAKIAIAFPQRDLHVKSFIPSVSLDSSNGVRNDGHQVGKN